MNMPCWLGEGLLFSRLLSQEDCIQLGSFTLLCCCSFASSSNLCCYFPQVFFHVSIVGTVVKSLPSCQEMNSLLVPLTVSLRLVIKGKSQATLCQFRRTFPRGKEEDTTSDPGRFANFKTKHYLGLKNKHNFP